MSQDQLRQAFALLKQGEKRQATQIVQDVIKQDRSNVSAWWLLANVLDDPTRKQKALEKVLSLDANHSRAQQMLASLKSNGTNGNPAPATTQPNAPSKPSSTDGKSDVELEFDWRKLDERDAKKKERPETSSDNAVKIATYLMVIFPVVIALGLGIFIGVPAYRNNQTAGEIKAVMTDFLNAMIAGDFETAETYVCQGYRSDSEHYFALDIDDEIYEDYTADFSELEITVSDFTSETATANLVGDVSLIPTEGEQQLTSVDVIMGSEGFAYGTTSFRFFLENDQWLICDRSFRSG